jgi:hypothetical protein
MCNWIKYILPVPHPRAPNCMPVVRRLPFFFAAIHVLNMEYGMWPIIPRAVVPSTLDGPFSIDHTQLLDETSPAFVWNTCNQNWPQMDWVSPPYVAEMAPVDELEEEMWTRVGRWARYLKTLPIVSAIWWADVTIRCIGYSRLYLVVPLQARPSSLGVEFGDVTWVMIMDVQDSTAGGRRRYPTVIQSSQKCSGVIRELLACTLQSNSPHATRRAPGQLSSNWADRRRRCTYELTFLSACSSGSFSDRDAHV